MLSPPRRISKHDQYALSPHLIILAIIRRALTLPSVTVRNVSITLSFVSILGASSRNPMTTCTIFVIACLSWPCFLLSSSTCSFKSDQSPEFLHIVTKPTMRREVEGRSEACRACFSSASSFSIASCVWPDYRHYVSPTRCYMPQKGVI